NLARLAHENEHHLVLRKILLDDPICVSSGHRVDFGEEPGYLALVETIELEEGDLRGQFIRSLNRRRELALDIVFGRFQLLLADSILMKALYHLEGHVKCLLGCRIARIARYHERTGHLAQIKGRAGAIGET